MADLSKTEKLINDVLRQDAEFAITPLRAGRYVSAACYVEREADPGKGQTESIIKMIYDLAIENNNRGQAQQRIDHLSDFLRKRWEALNCCYPLSIEQELVEANR